ncbi:MAG: DNA polymerase III subunit alpha, partial [bacterium]
MLDGLGKIDDLVKKAVACKMPAMALTDHGVMYGAVEFVQKAKKAGLKAIIGVEAYVARGSHKDKNSRDVDGRPYHLILLAKNETGYRNIVKLTTIAHLEGYYYKPRIDWELLKQHSEGVVILTACLAGELPSLIMNNDLDGARAMINRFQDLVGAENFFLEVQHHPELEKQGIVNEAIFKLAQETGALVVATNDVHYVNKDDDYAQDVLLCIQTKRTLSETDRMSFIGSNLSFKTPEEMLADWVDHPEVISNTLKVAELCNFQMKLGGTVLPVFELPDWVTPDMELHRLSEEGVLRKYGAENITEEIKTRLEYELSVIVKTGYAGYFLIVSDFIRWAKRNGVVVGPGRGSAAGSLVAYATDITDVDPIKYDLVFERFLNPERISMPDIDTDFADARRDDVLRYVQEKYGKNKVAQIITFGTMAARAALRDVGRVQSLPYSFCDKVAKLIPLGSDLQEALDTVPEMKEVMTSEDGKKLIETALRLEGVVRHASTHACGVVITPEDIDYYGPRQYGSDGDNIVIQYDGHSVEGLGLLKMDFLGLSNLTIIERTIEIIEKIHGLKVDINKIPLQDKKSFELFQKGDTTGVFQLESSGMKRYLKQLQANDIEDIIAMVALYRPGPMEYIPDYINGKHGVIEPKYLHPKLKPILEKTYGVAVYQEQLMRIARDLAGFSYGEADVLRKAVGKKIKELLDQQEIKIIDGMVKNGIDREVAKKIWEFILPFASYGFNRSHAACYAMIAYQTAYMKAHYPAEFMAALMTSDQGNTERVAIEAEECKHMGIAILPPDVNESFSTFTVVVSSVNSDKPVIRFGLLAVKGLGENVVQEIIAERKVHGLYKDLADLLTRVKTKDLNKRSLEALIKAGCLDSMGERNQLLMNMEKILRFVTESHIDNSGNQDSLFAMTSHLVAPKLTLEIVPELDKKQKLTWEKEALGLYVSDHPMREFKERMGNFVIDHAELKNMPEEKEVRVAGVVSTIKKIFTKKNETMLFVRLEDGIGSVEILVFPKVLEGNQHLWQPDNVIICHGRISKKDEEPKILCERAAILNLDNLSQTMNNFLLTHSSGNGRRWEKKKPIVNDQVVVMTLDEPLDYDVSKKLKEILDLHPGNFDLELIVNRKDMGSEKKKTNLKIHHSEEIRKKIEEVIGANRIV